jgi:hypothetical protein
MKNKVRGSTKLSSIPSVVQLPGGAKLSAIPFKVTAYHDDGSPKTFEILPADRASEYDFMLFADERVIRLPIVNRAKVVPTTCEHGTDGCTGRGEKHACPV